MKCLVESLEILEQAELTTKYMTSDDMIMNELDNIMREAPIRRIPGVRSRRSNSLRVFRRTCECGRIVLARIEYPMIAIQLGK